MDERELEARLGARLHRRFDRVDAPVSLERSVAAIFERPPVHAWQLGQRLAWAAGAAVIVVALAALALRPAPSIGPSPSPSPTPATTPDVSEAPPPTAADATQWILIVPNATRPPKAESALASDIYAARLRAFGVNQFSIATGDVIVVARSTIGSPSPTQVRMLLGSTGDISIVALPVADYPTPDGEALLGEPLPVAEPTLVGEADIDAITPVPGTSPGQIRVAVAAPGLDAYARSHPADGLAILLDGRIAGLANTTTSINGSTVTFSTTTTNRSLPFPQLPAVLDAWHSLGPLPESWRGAAVPDLPDLPHLTLAATTEWPGAVITAVELTTDPDPSSPAGRPVWLVQLRGLFDCGANRHPPAGATPCAGTFDTARLVLDAETAAVIRTEIAAP
jgi:hypothetical protein